MSGGPTGNNAPPMLLTRKTKNAICIGATRPLFIAIHGRISSIDAPMVPIRFPKSAPTKRNRVFLIAPLGDLTRK